LSRAKYWRPARPTACISGQPGFRTPRKRAGNRSMFTICWERENVMKNLFLRFVREEDGQDLVEYAFLIIFIAFVAAAGANALGIGINTLFSDIGEQVSTLSAPGLPSPGGGGS
jgi:Flp pilus assembly pilin Flp